MTCIKIEINREQKKISVYNDGEGIPVDIHKEMNIYVPHMIFGELLTSDNYDDAEDRITGGRNGFGAKLTNIFSKEFTVQCGDNSRKREFKMTWSQNMSKFSEPHIKNYNGKDYVKVTFKPDLDKFGMTELDDDIECLLHKRVYDLAGTCNVRVYLNGSRLPVKDFKSYVDLYLRDNSHPANNPSVSKNTLNGNTDASVNKTIDNLDVSVSQDNGGATGDVTPSKTAEENGNSNFNNNKYEEEIVKIHEKQHR
ncbi:DNA topoisomerase 2, putative (TOP2), partial [Plasmodium ovale curtisi]